MYLSSYVVLVKRNAKPDAVMAILCQVALDACVVERERGRERERKRKRARCWQTVCVNTLVTFAEDFRALWRAESMPCWQYHAVSRYRKLAYLEKDWIMFLLMSFIFTSHLFSFFFFFFFEQVYVKLHSCTVVVTTHNFSCRVWHTLAQKKKKKRKKKDY